MSVSSSSRSSNDEFTEFISLLPKIPKTDTNSDGCPICLLPWDGIEQEGFDVDYELDLGGITKLEGCGHTFCRRDLAHWILSGHGSCPICRHVFLSTVETLEPETSDDDYTPSSDMDYGADSASDWMDADQEWEDEADESYGSENESGGEGEGEAPTSSSDASLDSIFEEGRFHTASEVREEGSEDVEPRLYDTGHEPLSPDANCHTHPLASQSDSSGAVHTRHTMDDEWETTSSES